MSDSLRLQLLFDPRIPVRSRRGVCQFNYIILRLTYPDFIAEANSDWRQHLGELRCLSQVSYAGIQYNVQFKSIDAANYGVPQIRERVAIVGIRSDLKVPGGENMIRYPDDRVRYLTVLEAKRLQTFPDDFAIEGAWGEAMRQIGNAVPVLLAEALGRELVKTLNVHHKKISIEQSLASRSH